MKQKCLAMLVFTLLLIIGTVLAVSCAQKEEIPTQIIQDITAKEAYTLIKENQGDTDFIIVDVRTPEEFAGGHIENAINVDFRSDAFESKIGKLDRDKKYLIYCRSGSRSRGALNIMVTLNFKEVYHLPVGITGWLEEGLPTMK